MTLSLSDATAWLVANGYSKVDGQPSKSGKSTIYQPPDAKHWTFHDCTAEHGSDFINITPDSRAVNPADPTGANYADISLNLRVEGGAVVHADLFDDTGRQVIAVANQPPCSGEDLGRLLEAGQALWSEIAKQHALEMEALGIRPDDGLHESIRKILGVTEMPNEAWQKLADVFCLDPEDEEDS